MDAKAVNKKALRTACCWLDVPLCGYMRIRSWTGYAGAAAAVMAIIITYRTSANWKGRLPCEC